MPHLDITNDDLKLIRLFLERCRPGFDEWCRKADDLLDRLPEPLDELILGAALGLSPDDKEAIREARYRVENGGL